MSYLSHIDGMVGSTEYNQISGYSLCFRVGAHCECIKLHRVANWSNFDRVSVRLTLIATAKGILLNFIWLNHAQVFLLHISVMAVYNIKFGIEKKN